MKREQFRAEVSSVKSNGTIVHLGDLLTAIEDSTTVYWGIVWLEAIGKPTKLSMLELEQLINTSQNVYQLSWQHLKDIASSIEQTIEIVLIGSLDKSAIRKYDTDEKMTESVDYFIEIVDNDSWTIISTDLAFVQLTSTLV